MIILVVVNLRLRNSQIIRKYDESPKRKEVFRRDSPDLRSRYDLETISTYSIKLNIKNLKRGIALKYLVSFARMVTVTRGCNCASAGSPRFIYANILDTSVSR